MAEPPGEGMSDLLGEAWRKTSAHMSNMADEIGASFAGNSITPGENIRLEPEMANALLDRAQDLRDKLQDIKGKSNALQQVKPAADDLVSTGYNKKLTNAGDVFAMATPFSSGAAFDAGAKQLEEAVNYLDAYISKLGEALGKTKAQDQHNEEDLKKVRQDGTTHEGGYI